MFWIVLWTLLLLGALLVWFLLGRRLWRQTKVLGGELASVTEQLEAVSGALAGMQGSGAQPVTAAARPAGDAPVPAWDARRHRRRKHGR